MAVDRNVLRRHLGQKLKKKHKTEKSKKRRQESLQSSTGRKLVGKKMKPTSRIYRKHTRVREGEQDRYPYGRPSRTKGISKKAAIPITKRHNPNL